jgi:hypothetical protein
VPGPLQTVQFLNGPGVCRGMGWSSARPEWVADVAGPAFAFADVRFGTSDHYQDISDDKLRQYLNDAIVTLLKDIPAG